MSLSSDQLLLENLPDEILLELLSYLSFDDLGNMRMVSKPMYTLGGTPRLYKDLWGRNDSEALEYLVSSCGQTSPFKYADAYKYGRKLLDSWKWGSLSIKRIDFESFHYLESRKWNFYGNCH